MSVRVPTSTTYSRLERGLQTSLGRVQELQGQLSSGARISKISDDAVGASTGMRLRSEEADWAAYGRSASDAQSTLAVTDATLNSMVNVLSQVRQRAVEGNNSSLDGPARAAVADEIKALRDQMGDLANYQHLGRAIFGGHRATAVTSTGTPPVYSYAGDSGVVTRQVSPSVTTPVNLDGQDVLGFSAGAGNDVFSMLTQLEADVRSGNAAGVTAGQTALTARTGDVLAGLSKIGAMANRVTAATDLGTATVDSLEQQRSDIEDIDLAATVMHLQVATNAYTAALGAVSKANLPSLADFLR